MSENKKVKYSALFKRSFKRRVMPRKKLSRLFNTRLTIFEKNPEHPVLRNHLLKDNLDGYKSFWVDNEYRVIYIETEKYYIFLDIGTHEQVYGRRKLWKVSEGTADEYEVIFSNS